MEPKEKIKQAEETLQKEFPSLTKEDCNAALCLIAYVITAVETAEKIPERLMMSILGSGLIDRMTTWKFVDKKQQEEFLKALDRATELLYKKETPAAPPLSNFLNQLKESK